MLATQSTWTDVTLTKPSGEKLVDASVPYGSPLSPVRDAVSVRLAVESRRATIGIVSAGRATMLGVPVRVPVFRDGVVRYVLSAIVRPDSFGELIAQQRLPDEWIGGIVDSRGHFVARVPERPAGDLASSPFREALLKAPEGWYRGLTVEGRDTYTAHVRSELTGWDIGLAIPADIVLGGFRKTAWLIGAGVLGSIGVAMFIVGVSGRRIVRPIVSPRDPRPCRVLLVEDNTDAREMLKQVLEMEGHDVVEAADGLSGVAAGDAHDIDVAVVDIGLPDIDGHEVARRLRQGRNGRATLIALTGYGQPEDRERALAAGFDIHLVKPATLERLNEAIALAAAPRAG